MGTEEVREWLEAGKDPRYRPRTLEQKLGYLVEECGEVLAAVGKTQRWGTESTDPTVKDGENNRQWLMRELADLELAIGIARCALNEVRDSH